MAVEWVRQISAREGRDNIDGKPTAQRVVKVKCSDKLDAPETALAACPGVYSAYSDSSVGVFCTSRECKELERTGDGGTIYEVTFNYATIDPEKQEPNPLKRTCTMTLGFDSYEETRYEAPDTPDAVDADGNDVEIGPTPLTPAQKAQGGVGFNQGWPWKTAVCNSAGRPFDPSVTDIYRDPVVTIKKNLAALPWDVITKFKNAVNKDAFTIKYRGNTYPVGVGTAWMFDLASVPQFENNIAFEEVTIVLKIREDGWRRKILDQGLEEMIDLDHKIPRPILDANGDPIRSPALLDGKGKKLAKGASPVFLRWFFKDYINFGYLPFWS